MSIKVNIRVYIRCMKCNKELVKEFEIENLKHPYSMIYSCMYCENPYTTITSISIIRIEVE
jgi:uncharacterized protein with PIN domain